MTAEELIIRLTSRVELAFNDLVDQLGFEDLHHLTPGGCHRLVQPGKTLAGQCTQCLEFGCFCYASEPGWMKRHFDGTLVFEAFEEHVVENVLCAVNFGAMIEAAIDGRSLA